jgi:hypothetical protein
MDLRTGSVARGGHLPVRSVVSLMSERAGLQLPPMLAFLVLLPLPRAPVPSLFPGGAVQHVLPQSSGRCSPLPTSSLVFCEVEGAFAFGVLPASTLWCYPQHIRSSIVCVLWFRLV